VSHDTRRESIVELEKLASSLQAMRCTVDKEIRKIESCQRSRESKRESKAPIDNTGNFCLAYVSLSICQCMCVMSMLLCVI
jgi:hypothetical protein